MFIGIALARMDQAPPDWLIEKIAPLDLRRYNAAINPRRRRELAWSRGLKTILFEHVDKLQVDKLQSKQNARCDVPPGVSIAHDGRYVAVAISQSSAIGMDIQSDRSTDSCTRIVEAWFPRQEAEEIFVSNGCERFMISWTIKEAWAKCFNRSIFQACQSIAVWSGAVHIADEILSVPRFARARTSLRRDATEEYSSKQELTIGICHSNHDPTQSPLVIECFVACSDAKIRRHIIDWSWLPVMD